jgi:phosphoglycolate phosphatase-like HAD superfamily hydrolase
MKTTKKTYKIALLFIGLTFILNWSCIAQKTSDPLPSWNDTKTKKNIITFVEQATKVSSQNFIPIAERIATFDNDGTLWSEQPLYFQYFFSFDRIKELSAKHPEWKTKEPFASVLKGNLDSAMAGGDNAIMEMFAAPHVGLTTDQYEKSVKDWVATAKHPTTKKLFTDMIFQPMVELLNYLRANGFKTFIVSGGEIDFMRPWAEKAYGIPPEQVIGSSVKMKFELSNDTALIIGQQQINFIDDAEGKPICIQSHIGRRPVFACGNSDGDLQMMQWTSSGKYSHFCLYVHHTDAIREWAYDRKSSIGQLDKGLDQAAAKGWTVIDMKNDWKIIYPSEKK